MRTFKFKLLTGVGQNALLEINFDGRTMRDLKTVIRGDSNLKRRFDIAPDSDLSELALIDRATRTSYHLDDAVLPSTDTIFFVTLTKSKGGGYIPGRNENIEYLDESELEELAQLLNDEYAAGIYADNRNQLLEQLYDFYTRRTEEEEEIERRENETQLDDLPIEFDDLSVVEKIRLCAEILEGAADTIASGGDYVDSKYVTGVTERELEQEASDLYLSLRKKGLV